MAHSLLENVDEQTFTDSTIRRMYALIDRAKTDAEFQKLIYGIVNGSMRGQWKNYQLELSTILSWARKAVDYRRDPFGVELLQDVWATLDRRRGDCDDFTVLLGAAAEVLGSPVRIVTVSTRRNKEPNHVYLETFAGGRWLGMDATMPGTPLGWRPPQVTDRKVWSRKSLGLGGEEDFESFEGLGMMGNGYQAPGFRTDMRPVSKYLAPGVPDDVSDTFADPMPGTSVQSRRVISQAPIANVADRTSNPRPGGGVYNPALPIKSMPTPEELWYLVERNLIPKVLNPDKAWWGAVPTAREDFNRMFPGSEGTMANYLKDVLSAPASAIARAGDEISRAVRMGEIGADELGDVLDGVVEEMALEGFHGFGDLGKIRSKVRQVAGKKRGIANKAKGRLQHQPAAPADRRYLVPGPQRGFARAFRGGHLNGLGDFIDDIAKSVSAQISTGNVSADQAINQAVAQVTGSEPKQSTAETRATAVANVAKSAIPIGMIALLGLAALAMSGGARGSRVFRSNPRRGRSYRYRPSRRGGRRGGGLDLKTLLLIGGGGFAAYQLLLKPGAALLPKALSPMTQTVAKAPSTSDQVKAAAIAAAPTIAAEISKLFTSSGSSTPAPTADAPTLNIQSDWSSL